MKKSFIVAALFLFAGTTVYITSCQNKSQKQSQNQISKEDSAKNLIARGEYLANHVTVCIDCHSIRDTGRFSMPIVPGTEGVEPGFHLQKLNLFPVWLCHPTLLLLH
jgi:cytochrome c553